MKEIQHNLAYEKRLIELLGYNMIGPDNSNRWLIVDRDNNQVGFIQYKKLHKGNLKKKHSSIFGYCTTIDSSDISFKYTRKTNDVTGKVLDNMDSSYEFEVKRENDEVDHIEIDMSNYPSLRMWSKKYGFTDFHVDDRGLYLNFKSRTENFNVEETLVFKSNGGNRQNSESKYVYQIRYCNKEKELSDNNPMGITTREISGTNNQYYQEFDHLKLAERTWVNGKLRTNRENEVIGTVEEMAIKHQIGIDSFNHFRFLINQILPFKQDIISTIVSEELIIERGLLPFFPSYKKENTESKTQKKLKK